MGNKMSRRRVVVDERYTRPQGLYPHWDIDLRKLRSLILDAKLAPCYLGEDESAPDLEDCPICFLYYPSLNRSKCCMKSICTECFLQIRPSHSTRHSQCPFCKTSNYTVEYRGVKTKEEKGMEQVEEQKVIEAQIRMRLQELQGDAERIKKKQALSLSYTAEDDEFVSSQPSSSMLAGTQSTYSRQDSFYGSGSHNICFSDPQISVLTLFPSSTGDENCDLDLEDVMVLEAIRRSLQEHEAQVNPASSGSILSEAPRSDHSNPQLATSSGISPPNGFASAIAAIAEHQHMSGEVFASAYQMLRSSGILHASRDSDVSTAIDSPVQWTDMTPNGTGLVVREDCEGTTEWWSDEAEAGTSYAASSESATSLVLPENPNLPAGHFLPESFEEQMMVALALSLAENRAGANCFGLT